MGVIANEGSNLTAWLLSPWHGREHLFQRRLSLLLKLAVASKLRVCSIKRDHLKRMSNKKYFLAMF